MAHITRFFSRRAFSFSSSRRLYQSMGNCYNANSTTETPNAGGGGASGTSVGKGDMDIVRLRHGSGASAEIYLHGATLCSYKTPNGKERIFVSPGAIFDGKKAIRGGVPVVFPQFGQPNKAMPQHGFARSKMWSLEDITDSVDESRATFILKDDQGSREVWDHAFQLQYTVSLTAVSLKMSLKVTNTGSSAFDFMFLLHTYFSIPSFEDVGVRGLTGRNFVDKVTNGAVSAETNTEVTVPRFTDRIYVGQEAVAKDVTIVKKGGSVTYASVRNEAAISFQSKPCDVVVWNPNEEASPGDLPVPAFKEFICVEPGLVNEMHSLPARGVATLSQRIIPGNF